MGSENFYPGEPLADDEIRVTLLGTGTPFPRRGQASASIFVEAGGDGAPRAGAWRTRLSGYPARCCT